MIKKFGKAAVIAISLSISYLSSAAVVTGSIPSNYDEPTFNGNGIPNDQITYMDFGDYLLGIAITQRYASAPVTNNGADYFAAPGLSTNYDAATQTGSTWNFSFYAAINPNANVSTFNEAGLTSLALHYDMDPTSNTDYGIWDFTSLLGFDAVPVIQASQNYLFSFLNVTNPDIGSGMSITAPSNNGYDEFGEGNFEIKWVANGQDAVSTNVTVAVPTPSSISLMLLAGIGLISARKFSTNK